MPQPSDVRSPLHPIIPFIRVRHLLALPRRLSRRLRSLICESYQEVKSRFNGRTKDLPLGAIAMYTFAQKVRTGLQQLMAGSRNFSLGAINRRDLMSLTKECAEVSGIPYVMDAYRDEAERILAGK